MDDKLGILINAILNVEQEDLQTQLDSVAKKIKINLRPRIDFDENVIAKFKSDVDKLAKNIKLNLQFDVDKQSVKDAEKIVTETATKISEKSKSENKIKVFDIEQLEAEGRQFFISTTDIVNRVKNQFKDLGDVNVNFLKNAKNQIVGFEAEIKKLDGTIEQLRFNMAKIKVGDSTKEGFVFSGANLIDKNAGDVLQRNLNILQKFETRLKNIRDTFTSSRGVKEPTNLSILNREYNFILSTIEKLRKSQSNLTEEQKRNIDKQINTLWSLYKAYRDIEITAEKGFNFKQFENITGQVIKLRENLNATVVTLKNYKDALSTPLLQGYRITGLNYVQETEEYLKLTQKLQKGNEFVDLTAYIDKATGSIYKYSHASRNAMIDTLTWSKAIQTAWKRMAQWATGGTLFFGTLRQIKEGISYITELDNSLNEIRIVTNKTQQEVNNLALSYNKLAKEMSVTTREIASTAADLFRQGLNDSQVEERMKAIIQYAKISGISLQESNKIITATANATGESVRKIVDIFAYLGDATASGAEEIGEALQKVASTAENSGVSLEKAASWIATISSITRESASSIGNSLKTIISRYEQIKAKGFNEEDATQINDVTKALQAVGITAVDAQGQLRPIAEVLDELGAKWNSLTKNEQAYVATTLAGTYQRNRLITLLDNYNDSLKNYEIALNSAGTAEQKFAIYQESTRAALDKFTATWEEMWQHTLSSDTIKTIINLGTVILNLVDKIGLLPVALSTAFGALFLFNKSFQTFATNIAPIVLQKLGLIVTAENGIAIAANGAALSVKTLSLAFTTFAPLVIAGAIYGLVKAFNALNVSLEEYKNSVDESYNKAQSNIEQLKQWQKEYEGLANKTELTRDEKAKLIEIERQLKTRFGETAQAIDLQNGSLETNIDLMRQLTKEEAERFITLNERAYREAKKILESPYNISFGGLGGMQFENIEAAIKSIESSVRDAVDKSNIVYNVRKKILEELYEEYDNATDIISKYEGYEKLLQHTVDKTSESLQEYEYNLKQLNNVINSVQSDLKTLNQVLDDVQNGQSLNAETVLDLIQKYPELTDAIHKTADGWTIEKDAIEILRKAKIEEARTTIENQINSTKATLDNVSARVNAYGIEIAAIEDLKSAQQEASKLGFKRVFGETAFEDIKFDDLTNKITVGDKITEWSKEEYDKIKQSFNEQKLANDTILKIGELKERSKKLLELLSDPNFGVSSSKSSSSKSTEIYEAEVNQFQQLEDALAKVNDEIERNQALTDIAEDKDKINLLSKRIDLYKEEQKILHQLAEARRDTIQKNIGKLQDLGFDIFYDRNTNELVIRNMEHLNELKGKDAEATNKLRKETEELIKETLSLNDANRQAGNQYIRLDKEIASTTDSIENLRKEQKKYAEDLIESYQEYLLYTIDKQIEKYEELKKSAQERARMEIDSLNAEIERLERKNEELKEQEEREKRLSELAKQRELVENIQKQRNVRILQDGKWVYVADPKKLKEETDKLKEMEEDYSRWEAENRRENEIQKLKDQIKSIQDELKEEEKRYDEKIKKLQDFTNAHREEIDKQKFQVTSYSKLVQSLAGIEEESYEQRLDLLDKFVKDYNKLMSSIKTEVPTGNVYSSDRTSKSSGSSGGGSSSSSSKGATGYTSTGNASVDSKLEQMVKNSQNWHFANDEEKKKLEEENKKLAEEIAKSTGKKPVFDSATGKWDVLKYDTGGVNDYTGFAILHGKPNAVETVFNAEQGKKLYDFVKNLPYSVTDIIMPKINIPEIKIPFFSNNNSVAKPTENHYHFENLNIQANDPNEMFRKLNMLIEQYT